MNITNLNSVERQLTSRVKQALGSMEEKHDHLLNNGVYADYRKVYESYVALIESKGEGLEALKRALFLNWYEQAEPSCFSGLYELPENGGRKVFESLERKITTEAFDVELKWMLPYYKEIAEWVFFPYSDLSNLHSYLAKTNANLVAEANLKAEDFENRGQMGDYWQDIINSNGR